MTEYFKRFTMAKDEVTVIDFGENEVFECKYSDEAKSLCNVLNDLDYEKYNLKKENEQFRQGIIDCIFEGESLQIFAEEMGLIE